MVFKRGRICSSRRTIRLRDIEARVLASLEAHLLAPDIVEAAVEAYREGRARLNAERARGRRNAERDLAAVDRRIAGIVAATRGPLPSALTCSSSSGGRSFTDCQPPQALTLSSCIPRRRPGIAQRSPTYGRPYLKEMRQARRRSA